MYQTLVIQKKMPWEKNNPENFKYSSCQRTGNLCHNPSTKDPHWTFTCPRLSPGGRGASERALVPKGRPRQLPSVTPPACLLGTCSFHGFLLGSINKGLKNGSAPWSHPDQGKVVGEDWRGKKCGPIPAGSPSLVYIDAIKKPVYIPWRALVVLFRDELGE